MTTFISREQIDEAALNLRKALGISDQYAPDLQHIIQFHLQYIFPGFRLLIVTDHLLPNAEAEADCQRKTITVRQSVYDDLVSLGSRARMTIAHEIGHLALHEGVFQRAAGGSNSVAESQARYFAASFLMPEQLVEKFRSVPKIVGAFQVGEEAARRRLREMADKRSAKRREWRSWLRGVLPKHKALLELLEPLLVTALRDAGVCTFPIESRVKMEESAFKKIIKKKYSTPTDDLTDLSGVRVITYTSADVERVGDLIKSLFVVNERLDKRSELSVNKMGYQSLHFVCVLGPDRANLPEYSRFKGLRFELQIRTALEHVWAEIAHSRIYKSRINLCEEDHRRLNQLSVQFELLQEDVNELIAKLPTRAAGNNKAQPH